MSILKFPWPVLLCINVNKSEDDDEARHATGMLQLLLAASIFSVKSKVRVKIIRLVSYISFTNTTSAVRE